MCKSILLSYFCHVSWQFLYLTSSNAFGSLWIRLASRVWCFALPFRAIHTWLFSHNNSRDNSLPQVSTHFTITTTHGHTFLNLEFWGWILDGRKLPSRIDLDGQIGPGHKCLLLPPGHQKIWKDIYITIRQFSTSQTKRLTSVLYSLERSYLTKERRRDI